MTMTTRSLTLSWFSLALLLGGCDSDSPLVDGAPPSDATLTDGSGEAGTHDAGVPLANVYLHNPVEDKKQTSQVPLHYITDPEGKLTGSFAKVFNCYNEEGGEKIDVTFGGMPITGKMCHQAQKETPGTDRSYLHIEPPELETDGNDGFAAVNMYYHISKIHDYFAETLGLEHIKKKQLRALVNIQAYIDLMGGWFGTMQLTAYVSKEASSLFKIYFGVDVNQGEDTIIFSQDNTTSTIDPAYDASVIYHEYTHAALGSTVMLMPTPDKHGVDPTPRGMNEAMADYFAASLLDHSVIGSYALEPFKAQRDLKRVFSCPDHIIGEEHHDGEVAAGALWAVRELLGKATADQAIWNAALSFGMTTNFEQAGQAILAEIKKLAPDKETQVKQIFEERGMIGCVRLKDHKDFSGGDRYTGIAYPDPIGTTFPDGTPAYIQHKVQIQATTQELTIEYVPSSGSLMGIGGAKGDVWVALKPGSDPITYDYASGKAVSTATAVLKGADEGNGYKLVLSGSCIQPGDLIFQFINKGTQGGTINKVTITQSDTKTNTIDNFECP